MFRLADKDKDFILSDAEINNLHITVYNSELSVADLDGIKIYADKLFQDPRVEKLYGLFACMVTGRSWRSIQKGIDKAEKNSAESQEIKDNVAKYMKEIADVLAFVNRQMILIFKTNDLLRNIEFSLGTQNRYIEKI